MLQRAIGVQLWRTSILLDKLQMFEEKTLTGLAAFFLCTKRSQYLSVGKSRSNEKRVKCGPSTAIMI